MASTSRRRGTGVGTNRFSDRTGEAEEDILEPLSARPQIAQGEVPLRQPGRESSHQRRDGRSGHEVLTGGPFADGGTYPGSQRAGVEAGLGRETELFGATLDLALTPCCDDLAMVDDHEAVGETLHLVELVAREDDTDAVRAQAGNYIADRDATGRVDSGRRFVEKDRHAAFPPAPGRERGVAARPPESRL